jgi:hypothetical protein
MRKLGKRAARLDHGLSALSTYALAKVGRPLAPAVSDWPLQISGWRMLLNDQLGDCTAAACAHLIRGWNARAQRYVQPGDAETLAFYSASTGYVPGEPNTDQGGVMADVARFWLLHGFPTPDPTELFDRPEGVATVSPLYRAEVKSAIWEWGILAGIELPASAQNETVWTQTTDDPGTWGGHCVPLLGYTAQGPICISWGAPLQMTWPFWERYASEALVLLSRDLLTATGRVADGEGWEKLAQDMAALPPLAA